MGTNSVFKHVQFYFPFTFPFFLLCVWVLKNCACSTFFLNHPPILCTTSTHCEGQEVKVFDMISHKWWDFSSTKISFPWLKQYNNKIYFVNFKSRKGTLKNIKETREVFKLGYFIHNMRSVTNRVPHYQWNFRATAQESIRDQSQRMQNQL